MRRLEIHAIPLVCEWDEEDGNTMVGMGGQRDRAWEMMHALHAALLRETGAEWVDNEMRERIDTRRCVGLDVGAAVVWSASFRPATSVRYVPKLIAAAAGIHVPELEL